MTLPSPPLSSSSSTPTSSIDRKNVKCMGPYTVSQDPPLYLTSVEYADIPEMVRILNINQDVYNGSALFQYPFLPEHGHEKIHHAQSFWESIQINTHFAMRTSLEPGSPIVGWAHLHFDQYSDKHPQPVSPLTGKPLIVSEVGYWLSPEHTGKGFAARAGKFLIHEIAHKELSCDIVRAVSYTVNVPSRKVLERAGMVVELESKSIYIPKLDTMRDVCCYVSHKDESTKHLIKETWHY